MLKIMTILGTRPEIIRLSETIKKLDIFTNHVLVSTNQSYDYELNQIFFDELGIRAPDYSLAVKAGSVGQQIGNILAQCEKAMLDEEPDAVLLLGDTNSALSCIVAKRLRIPIFHWEAGNRCFDDRVPEEINRRIVDHTSDISMCYTEHARRNLLREGIAPRDIFVIGSPLAEVYSAHKKSIEESCILTTLGLQGGNYFLSSIHREENVEDETSLRLLFMTLCRLGREHGMPVVLSTHPRTKKRLDNLNLSYEGITTYKPFGMFDYIHLQQNAFCNLSDSGTIHEDAAILGIPAINIRDSNERPEIYDTGNVIMSGVDPDIILDSVRLVKEQASIPFDIPPEYKVKNCSDKVVRLIIGLSKIVPKRKYRYDSCGSAGIQRNTIYRDLDC